MRCWVKVYRSSDGQVHFFVLGRFQFHSRLYPEMKMVANKFTIFPGGRLKGARVLCTK